VFVRVSEGVSKQAHWWAEINVWSVRAVDSHSDLAGARVGCYVLFPFRCIRILVAPVISIWVSQLPGRCLMFARPHPWAQLKTGRFFHGTRRHSSTRSIRAASVVYESTSLNPYFNLAFEDW